MFPKVLSRAIIWSLKCFCIVFSFVLANAIISRLFPPTSLNNQISSTTIRNEITTTTEVVPVVSTEDPISYAVEPILENDRQRMKENFKARKLRVRNYCSKRDEESKMVNNRNQTNFFIDERLNIIYCW